MTDNSLYAAIGLAVVLAALWLYMRPGTSAGPEPAVSGELICFGWNRVELAKILSDFSEMYPVAPLSDAPVSEANDGSLRVALDSRMPATTFLFLVNYARYPAGFEQAGRSIAVAGTSTVTTAFNPDPSMHGKRLWAYVPANDTAGDLVHVAVGREHFVVPFTNLRWKSTSADRIPPVLRFLLQEDEA